MASTALTVSWSSSWLNSLGGNLSEATKLPARRTALVVFAQKKATKTRKIILKEDVAYLGKMGEMLDVKAGYYRNYLLPLGKAQIVTPAVLK